MLLKRNTGSILRTGRRLDGPTINNKDAAIYILTASCFHIIPPLPFRFWLKGRQNTSLPLFPLGFSTHPSGLIFLHRPPLVTWPNARLFRLSCSSLRSFVSHPSSGECYRGHYCLKKYDEMTSYLFLPGALLVASPGQPQGITLQPFLVAGPHHRFMALKFQALLKEGRQRAKLAKGTQ